MNQPDSSSMQGRNVLITGANTGIGRVTARELARRGAHVFVAGKSRERTQPLIDEVKGIAGAGPIEWLSLDLASLDSVRACASEFLARNVPLHILVNNAGVAASKGRTTDGYEMAFGINHLGHFLLTQLLLQRIQSSAPARIVTVASRAHYRSKAFDWDSLQQPTRTVTALDEYAQSKLANETGLYYDRSKPRAPSAMGQDAALASELWRRSEALIG